MPLAWCGLALALTLIVPPAALAQDAKAARKGVLSVTLSHRRARAGDRVQVVVAGRADARAVLLVPGKGVRELAFGAGAEPRRAWVTLPTDAAEGLYVVHAWSGDRHRPSAVGKGAFLVGRMVLDFFLPAYVARDRPAADIEAYLENFGGLGGNTLVAHALITPDQAYFPSRIARTTVRRGTPSDLVERLLGEADARGLAVFLSVSWDMTRRTPYQGRMPEIAALMAELYALYAHHPSLAGFYSYQEGSGTYYVPYVRDFTAEAKRLNPGLLTAVAPFVDDPLLAGYLSTVDTLDVIIFQAQVMASYRPDNRKRYPLRRARDFGALGIGAKWLQDKFAVTHVELFGYLENRLAPDVLAAGYADIFGQIAGVATLPGADGIALFAYQPHIWKARTDPRVQRSRQAVADGLELFRRVQRAIGDDPNRLVMYLPYSDWIVERWTVGFLPAFDAFRRAGIPFDVLPYAPPAEEAHYPYFPFHMNPAVLERLLAARHVLVLPDVSGFQQTDSDLIDAFVRRGGVVVAFGPQLPMGRSYDRDRLFGGREGGTATARTFRVPAAFGARAVAGTTCALPAASAASWTPTTAHVLASFDDGSPAVLANAHGEGLALAVLPSAGDLAAACPAVLRDVLEKATAHAGMPVQADVDGLSEQSDVAIGLTGAGIAVAIVNHEPSPRMVRVRPLDPDGSWFDAAGGGSLESAPDGSLRIEVPGGGARIVELRRAGGRSHP
jgi:hypothetical protein